MLTLSDAATTAGFQLVHLAEVGSTNVEALALGAKGETRPTWVVADRQVAGRGRLGRDWVGLSGNLFATLLLTDAAPAARLSEICFVSALALDDALLTLAPDLERRFKVKWPNDALLDGAKVSGTLIEATTRGAISQIAIGIGVNVAHHPGSMPSYPTISLQEAGIAVDRDAVFEALSRSMVRALAVWQRGEGFDAIRAGWLARAHNLGHPIVVKTTDRRYEGIFVGIDAQGRLLLDTPDGRVMITAGDVAPALAGLVH